MDREGDGGTPVGSRHTTSRSSWSVSVRPRDGNGTGTGSSPRPLSVPVPETGPSHDSVVCDLEDRPLVPGLPSPGASGREWWVCVVGGVLQFTGTSRSGAES